MSSKGRELMSVLIAAEDTFVRKSSYTKADLLACAAREGEWEKMPPLPGPKILVFDRITAINEMDGEYGFGYVHAELDIRTNHPVFDDHFKNDPVMPACLMLDGLWQLTGFFLGWLGEKGRGRARAAGRIKCQGEITPKSRLVRYTVNMINRPHHKGPLTIGTANGTVVCDDKPALIAEGLVAMIVPFNSL
jgi:3-hydroxyacyl-[acyl-carrier protein] dehydratase/trans-2-decenoyl-[acyl-carrier protein] isomerase